MKGILHLQTLPLHLACLFFGKQLGLEKSCEATLCCRPIYTIVCAHTWSVCTHRAWGTSSPCSTWGYMLHCWRPWCYRRTKDWTSYTFMYPKYAILMLFNVKFKYVLLFSADHIGCFKLNSVCIYSESMGFNYSVVRVKNNIGGGGFLSALVVLYPAKTLSHFKFWRI